MRKLSMKDNVIHYVAISLASFALVTAIGVLDAEAGDQDFLTPKALFNRCYSHLTQRKAPANHPLMATVTAVGATRATAVNACMQIFDKGALQTSGGSEGRLVTESTEGLQVLQTFNDLHRTWFPNDSMVLSVPLGFEILYRTAQIHDESEAALHVTRALLTSGVHYREVVTSPSAIEAIRTLGPDPGRTAPDLGGAGLPESRTTAGGAVSNYTGALVATGDLLGLKRISLNAAKNDQVAYSSDNPEGAANQAIYVHRSLGGGILGSKSYLLLNMGRPNLSPNDGGARQPRRWAKAFYKDLLCRDLPVIRSGDAAAFVQPAGPNVPAFRTNQSCMHCHASMDRAASAARNASYVAVPGLYEGRGTAQIYVWPTNLAAETGVVNSDSNFHRRPPNGRFYFRSYDGRTLFDEPITSNVPGGVSGIAALGTILSNTNDLYACAAARYFKHFTGVMINLEDSGAVTLSAAETAYRNLVIPMGESLRTHGSLRTLIQSIISSDIYQRGAMRLPAQ
jgi:hypothetical protein